MNDTTNMIGDDVWDASELTNCDVDATKGLEVATGQT